jgi:hypothetical protein
MPKMLYKSMLYTKVSFTLISSLQACGLYILCIITIIIFLDEWRKFVTQQQKRRTEGREVDGERIMAVGN